MILLPRLLTTAVAATSATAAFVAVLAAVLSAAAGVAVALPDDDDADSVRLTELTDRIAPSLVRVHFYFKEDPDRPPRQYGMSWSYSHGQYESLIAGKQSMDMPGIVIGEGQVLISDIMLSEQYVDRIELSTAAGQIVPATLGAILLETPALLLTFDAEAHPLPALDFDERPDLEFGDPLAGIILEDSGAEWNVAPAGFSPRISYGEPVSCTECYHRGGSSSWSPSWFHYGGYRGSAPAVIADASGNVLGVATGSRFDLEQEYITWKGADLLASPRLTWPDYLQRKQQIEERYTDQIAEFALRFRQETDGGGYGSRYYGYMHGGRGNMDEEYVYGLPLAATRWLVPNHLQRQRANNLDTVEILEGDARQEVRFAGAYEEYGMALMEADIESASPSLADPPEAATWSGDFPAPYIEPYFTLRMERRFGREYPVVQYARNSGWRRGYENELLLTSMREMPEGTYILDLDGNLAGVAVRELHEGQEEKQFEEDRYSSYEDGEARLLPFADLAEVLRRPVDHLDPDIRQMTREEAKRRLWLGVEFSRITPDLARFLEVEKPTRSGSIGMIVNTVYPDSPAEKLGIQVGDILLKVRRTSQEDPTELTPPETYDYGYYAHYEEIRTSDIDLGYGWDMPPPWRERKNYLTELLAAFGEGETIELTWWSGGEMRQAEYTVVQAPVDFDSAPKFKDDSIGVTVKDLTYEVRNALQLPADKGGVVVSKVESGSPMAVADVGVNQLILEIDGQSIRDVEDFEQRIAALREEGADSARLTIWSLGKTRFADLSLDPAEILRPEFVIPPEFAEEFAEEFGEEFGD